MEQAWRQTQVIDIEREFISLSVAAESAGETQLLTRLVGSRGLRLGLDGLQGKHLLVPVDTSFKPDTASRGVHLVEQKLIHDGVPTAYADLRCIEPQLDMVFDRLVQDVVAQTENSDAPPVAVCKGVLAQWRELLRRGDALTTEGVVGLVGELYVLRQLAEVDPTSALDAWVGPRRTVHDFVTLNRAIEVKSTSTLEGTSVSIHGLDQLDPIDLEELYLAVVHCRPSETAPTLDEAVDDLAGMGIPRVPLLRAIANAGYVYESRPSISTRFRVSGFTVWRVGSNFPGLRRSMLSEDIRRGISNVRYTLFTDSAPRPLAEGERDNLFRDWFRNA